VLEAIENGAIPGLSFQELGLPFQVSTMNFIRYKEITDYDKEIVRRFEGSLILKRLLVLRGLFAHNILHFALTSKRWFVDYGIHPTRCLLAVPYRAKGIPSDSATFGHPEVALVLTCLSYYHEGLTHDQVRKCVSLLKRMTPRLSMRAGLHNAVISSLWACTPSPIILSENALLVFPKQQPS
jgi:hypothetical protein